MLQTRTMYHASYIVVSVLVCVTLLERGNAAKTQPLIEDLLSTLASHAGSVLGPNLSEAFKKNNRINATTISPITTLKPTKYQTEKSAKISTHTTAIDKSDVKYTTTTINPGSNKLKALNKLSEIIQDSARAPQTQLENQFPFEFRNNFQNYPGAQSLQGVGGQYSGGLFGGRDSFNSEIYRPFNSPLNNDNGGENIGQRVDPRFSGRNLQFNNINRPFNSLDSSLDLNRYQQNFDRFGFNERLPNSNQFFDQGFRTDGTNRFSNFLGQSSNERNNLLSNNYRQDLRANYQNSIVNDQGQNFLPFLGSSYPQQSYAQNSFDFLPSQRFQNSFNDEFSRNQPRQQAPNFPAFYPAPNNDGDSPVATSISSLANSNREKNNRLISQSISQSARRFSESGKNLKINTKKPIIDGVTQKIHQARDELVNIFQPLQYDYSDIRVRPDTFKQTLVGSNMVAKPPKE